MSLSFTNNFALHLLSNLNVQVCIFTSKPEWMFTWISNVFSRIAFKFPLKQWIYFTFPLKYVAPCNASFFIYLFASSTTKTIPLLSKSGYFRDCKLPFPSLEGTKGKKIKRILSNEEEWRWLAEMVEGEWSCLCAALKSAFEKTPHNLLPAEKLNLPFYSSCAFPFFLSLYLLRFKGIFLLAVVLRMTVKAVWRPFWFWWDSK